MEIRPYQVYQHVIGAIVAKVFQQHPCGGQSWWTLAGPPPFTVGGQLRLQGTQGTWAVQVIAWHGRGSQEVVLWQVTGIMERPNGLRITSMTVHQDAADYQAAILMALEQAARR